jgi:hypothetical protein
MRRPVTIDGTTYTVFDNTYVDKRIADYNALAPVVIDFLGRLRADTTGLRKFFNKFYNTAIPASGLIDENGTKMLY